MERDYWARIIRDATAEFQRLVQQHLDIMYREVFPALTELMPPEDRAAWYETVNWPALKEMSPELWRLYSADALQLARREQDKTDAELRQAGIVPPSMAEGPALLPMAGGF